MKTEVSSEAIYIAIVAIILVGFTIIFFLMFRKGNKKKFRLKVGYAIVNLTAPSSWDIKKVHDELTIIFRKILEDYPLMATEFRNSIDFYEYFLYNIETKPIDYGIYKVKARSEAITDRVFQLSNFARSENPFSSIPAKEANLLQLLLSALNTNNQELGKTSLMQLVQQIEFTNNDLNAQRKRNNISYILAIVGFILTLFFGIISIISFYKR